MSYLQHILQPGETVKFATRLHWSVYWPGLLAVALAVLGIVVVLATIDMNRINPVLLAPLGLLFAWGAFSLVVAWVHRWTTEIAVTNRRIIFKHGFFRRHTIEMNMDKVESVDVDQSVAGRLFGYGDILVRGTGASLEPLRRIAQPIEFRNHVTAG